MSPIDAFDADGYRRLRDAGATDVIIQPWLLFGAGLMASIEEKRDGIKRFCEEVMPRVKACTASGDGGGGSPDASGGSAQPRRNRGEVEAVVGPPGQRRAGVAGEHVGQGQDREDGQDEEDGGGEVVPRARDGRHEGDEHVEERHDLRSDAGGPVPGISRICARAWP